MNSLGYPDSDTVLTDLGDRFVRSAIEAVDGARDDYSALRAERPSWFPGYSSRGTANLLHERIWDRLVRAVGGMDGVHVVDQEPVRELRCGTQYLIRVKRHHPGDRISAYPTRASGMFWSNSVPTLEGLELFSLAFGYMWDAELRAVGEAVLSFRDGKDNPIWAIKLRGDTAEAAGFSWTPVTPDLPELDLSAVIREVAESGS